MTTGLVPPGLRAGGTNAPGDDRPELFEAYQQMIDIVGHAQPETTAALPADAAPQLPGTLRRTLAGPSPDAR